MTAASRPQDDPARRREERLWTELAPAAYDAAVAAWAAEAAPAGVPDLASATLRRGPGPLVASRLALAQRLLALTRTGEGQEASALFLRAWAALAQVVLDGPVTIASRAPSPPGAGGRAGSPRTAISDPALRREADALAAEYEREVDRYNARAAASLALGDLAHAAREHPDLELVAAMTRTPGVPDTVRAAL